MSFNCIFISAFLVSILVQPQWQKKLKWTNPLLRHLKNILIKRDKKFLNKLSYLHSSLCLISQSLNKTHQCRKYSQKHGYKSLDKIYRNVSNSIQQEIHRIQTKKIKKWIIALRCTKFMTVILKWVQARALRKKTQDR